MNRDFSIKGVSETRPYKYAIRRGQSLIRPLLTLTFILLGTFIAACRPAPSATPTPFPTPGTLDKTVNYWDIGLSMKYPDTWTSVQFNAGQLIISPTKDVISVGNVVQPFVAVRIVDPQRDLGLAKDATLDQVAAKAVLQQDVTVINHGSTNVAGIDSLYVEVQDDKNNLYGLAIGFRVPDGRTGVFVGVAPKDLYADLAPIFDQMRSSMALIKPASFALPTISAAAISYPQGGLTFSLPDGWKDTPIDPTSHSYIPSSSESYVDGSDYTNGPELILLAKPLSGDAKDALTKIIGSDSNLTQITVGGQPGYEIKFNDPVSGQAISFIGFASQDNSIINIFRWTTPGILSDALRPTLDSILASMKFGPITATLVPTSTAAPTGIVSTPKPAFFNNIPQNELPDHTLIIGSPDAPLHVVEFMDFSCPHCMEFQPTMHQFIDAYVRTGKARVEFRYMTFVGQDFSKTAAYAALCAREQGKAMEMSDQLFYLQQTDGIHDFTADNLATQATNLGMDGSKLKDCINSGKYASTLDAANTYATNVQLTGTPTILIAKGSDAPTYIKLRNDTITIPTYDILSGAADQLLGQ